MIKARQYAEDVMSGKVPEGKYVRLQCAAFIRDCDGSGEYMLNEKKLRKIEKILQVLKMPKGPNAGHTVYESLAGFQWLLLTAVFCIVRKDDPSKRRYHKVLLEICRKNGKTFIIGLMFFLLFYLEPRFSKFYSVAPDGALAREIKDALEPLIEVNKDILEKNEFSILRTSIEHLPTKTKYIPLNYSTNRMDAKEPNVFIADEIGALPNNYPIEAMESGQVLVENPLGFLISTKYPTIDNPLEEEVAFAKKVLDGLVEKEDLFALLYEPDNTKDWMTDDSIIYQGNPLARDIPSLWDRLKNKREEAIEMESKRENFVTKHCNIIYQGAGTETFIDTALVKACMVDHVDFRDREVYIGVDLSQSTDNTAVAMVADDEGTILADVIGFVPEGRIDEKTKTEKVDYRRFIEQMKCIACGDLTIDYAVVEDFVFQIEQKYGCRVSAIGYDRWNCLSSAQKWDRKYQTIEIRQHSSVLHSPTKLLLEKITNGEFQYERNDLLEINFQNARCTFDTNQNRYVNKKKSRGKVDMVVALINATFLLQQECYLNQNDFVAQIC